MIHNFGRLHLQLTCLGLVLSLALSGWDPPCKNILGYNEHRCAFENWTNRLFECPSCWHGYCFSYRVRRHHIATKKVCGFVHFSEKSAECAGARKYIENLGSGNMVWATSMQSVLLLLDKLRKVEA
mmetsp:Transcript_46327/g.99196  ORF Transcript_46327/g.99196 Transcript_46327/m.99196 type:complete len:126 (+) Transcript_46327:119-496(+)